MPPSNIISLCSVKRATFGFSSLCTSTLSCSSSSPFCLMLEARSSCLISPCSKTLTVPNITVSSLLSVTVVFSFASSISTSFSVTPVSTMAPARDKAVKL
ncbi:hypothetical protein CY35_12G031200 [Sphagnum magellanicum]|nr:hypothetical protein CY35_12G031200 [Sphagnum magellanicum]